jgi:O-antigen/teichoic acid export membrane protein
MHIGKSILGNLLAGSLGRIINALTPLLLVPLMIRTWGLHQYGEWLILTAIPGYIMLSSDFGLSGAVVNQLARSTAEGKRTEAICLYRTTWLLLTLLGGIAASLGMAGARLVTWKPLGVTLLAGAAPVILSWSLLQIFVGQQQYLLTGIYRSARRNPRNGFVQSIGYAFYLIVGCVCLWFKAQPANFLALNVAARVVFLGVMLIDTRHIMPDFTLSLRGLSLRAVRPYVVPGLGHAALPLINAFQNEAMVLVLGALLGPVSVAVFQTTRTAVNGAKSLTQLASSSVLQEIPALVGEGRMSVVRRLVVMNTQASLAGTLGWFCLLASFGSAIFHLWLHNSTVYSPPLVLLLLASMFPFAVANSYMIVLMATNQIHRAVVWLVLAGIGSLAVAAAGSVTLGLNGAAFGVIAFEALNFLVVCRIAARYTDVHVRESLESVFSLRSLGESYASAWQLLRTVPRRWA